MKFGDSMKDIKRYKPDISTGLTREQLEERIKNNLVNKNIESKTKSEKEIIRENVFTLFNIINIVLALAVLAVRSYKNLTFMGVIIFNTLISIIQEIR